MIHVIEGCKGCCEGCNKCCKAYNNVCDKCCKLCRCPKGWEKFWDNLFDRPLGRVIFFTLIFTGVCIGLGAMDLSSGCEDTTITGGIMGFMLFHLISWIYISARVVEKFDRAWSRKQQGLDITTMHGESHIVLGVLYDIVLHDVGFCVYVFVFIGSFGFSCYAISETADDGCDMNGVYVGISLFYHFFFIMMGFILYCCLGISTELSRSNFFFCRAFGGSNWVADMLLGEKYKVLKSQTTTRGGVMQMAPNAKTGTVAAAGAVAAAATVGGMMGKIIAAGSSASSKNVNVTVNTSNRQHQSSGKVQNQNDIGMQQQHFPVQQVTNVTYPQQHPIIQQQVPVMQQQPVVMQQVPVMAMSQQPVVVGGQYQQTVYPGQQQQQGGYQMQQQQQQAEYPMQQQQQQVGYPMQQQQQDSNVDSYKETGARIGAAAGELAGQAAGSAMTMLSKIGKKVEEQRAKQ